MFLSKAKTFKLAYDLGELIL